MALAQPGRAHSPIPHLASIGTFDLASAKSLIGRFDHENRKPSRVTEGGYNVFQLNLKGARKTRIGRLANGQIEPIDCYTRGKRKLPAAGHYNTVVNVLKQESDLSRIIDIFRASFEALPNATKTSVDVNISQSLQALEWMTEELWVKRKKNKKRPVLEYTGKRGYIRSAEESKKAIEQTPGAPDVTYHI